jgi:four helix bundle protein
MPVAAFVLKRKIASFPKQAVQQQNMSRIDSHKDLIVWQKSVSLAQSIYNATASFPSGERFGLGQQMRRAAISVASNIAEGSARHYRTEFLQFLHIARGSLAELETQASIAIKLGFIDSDSSIPAQAEEIGRLLTALIRTITNSA